jgi:hypothetical protein
MSSSISTPQWRDHPLAGWRIFGRWLMAALISYGFSRQGRIDPEVAVWANHRLFPKS